MKNNKENSRRWLREAENTLRQSRHAIEQQEFSLTCFLSEQTAQKALKAVLYWDGVRFITIHSVAELLKIAGSVHKDFLTLIDQGAKLDQYYLSTRYPDAVPEPAIPSELFAKDQAEEALKITENIFQLSKLIIAN